MNRVHRMSALVAALIIGVLAASCNTRARESTSTSTTATRDGTLGQNTSDSATAGATGQMGSSATGAPGGAPSEREGMSDPGILAALSAANDAGVAAGRLAEVRGGSAAVRSFAHAIVADNSAAKAKTDQVATQAGIAPQAGDAVAQLQRQAAVARDSLQALSGADFDRAYVASEIMMHQHVLDMVDRRMIPGAQSPGVRSLLTEVRPVIVQQLARARALGTQIAGGE